MDSNVGKPITKAELETLYSLGLELRSAARTIGKLALLDEGQEESPEYTAAKARHDEVRALYFELYGELHERAA